MIFSRNLGWLRYGDPAANASDERINPTDIMPNDFRHYGGCGLSHSHGAFRMVFILETCGNANFLCRCMRRSRTACGRTLSVRLLRFSIESQEAANSAATEAQNKLSQTWEQRRTRLDDAAGRFGERWTDASMFHARKVFDELLEHKSDPAKVSELIKGDKDKETNVKNVLNFLEQLAFWTITEKCSETVARDLFGGIVITIWHATEVWIKYQHAHRGRPQLWAQLETLYARWK